MNKNKSSPPRILVVEDEPDLRDTLGLNLELQGWTVELAESGQAALEKLGAGDYDLVLTDLKMPGMDGLTLLDCIRAGPGENLPVILMTGLVGVDIPGVYARGVDALLIKPFDGMALGELVQRSLTPVSERWRLPIPVASGRRKTLRLVEDSSLPQCLKEGRVQVGRGGFSLVVPEEVVQQESPGPGDLLQFEIRFGGDSGPDRLAGVGTLRWVRQLPAVPGRHELGIEFTSLEEPMVSVVRELQRGKSLRPYIPALP